MTARQNNGLFVLYAEERDVPLQTDKLQNTLSAVLDTDTPVAIELLFVDAEEIRTLNREQRQTDAVTDVLSFPALDKIFQKPLKKADFPLDIDENGNLFLGSIVINRERAKEQAEEYGHSLERELHYLLVHGILHCLGYDHMQEAEKAVMREQEERILSAMDIARE